LDLVHIDISRNQIEKLTGALPPGLVTLNMGYNRFTSLPHLDGCKRLRTLKADACYIEIIDVAFPDSLISIDLSYNKIQDVQTMLPETASVDLSYNHLMHVPDELLASFVRGTRLTLDHNEYFSAPRYRPSLGRYVCGQTREETLRRFELITGAVKVRELNNTILQSTSSEPSQVPPTRTVYDDPENAHDAVLQRSALASINVIIAYMRGKSLMEAGSAADMLGPSVPEVGNWLRATDPHPIYGISFPELLRAVVAAAVSHDGKDEFMRRIREEMTESQGLCLGGRIARLVNSCVGFIPDVLIQVPEVESLTNKVIYIMKVARKVTPDQKSFNELCRLHVAEMLDEHGVTNEVERDAYLDSFKDDEEA